MVRVRRLGDLVAGRLWHLAILTAAGSIGAASQAQAARYYWYDNEAGYYRPEPAVPHRRPKPAHHQAKKIEAPEKEAAKPQGPLIISVSIDKQNLKIYDDNGFFAEAPVSTGMKGHPTPMGVFSVLEKEKMHHSNIYSGAPMPFMQRITWSGVAIHAGVLPGYPASHGCIRMPMAFAVKMWNWTKTGARVLVTPGEMSPSPFSHPLLPTLKVVPPVAASEPQVDAPAAKSDKGASLDVTREPPISEARLELRPTVGHSDGAKPVIAEPKAPAPLREQTHTADASGAIAVKTPLAMTDAPPSGSDGSSRENAAPRTDNTPPTAEDAPVEATADLKPDAKVEEPKSEALPCDAKPAETASSDDKPVELKQPESVTAEIKPVEATTTGEAGKKPDAPAVAAPADDVANNKVVAVESATPEETADAVKTEAKTTEAKADDARIETPNADAPKSSEQPDDVARAAADVGNIVPDAKKDEARPPDAAKPIVADADPAAVPAPKRTGQIAVFISRKDSKLYVRQRFEPLFDAPVTIAPSDRPLGTHVFTAEIDKDDSNVVRWSVVSLPVPRHAERRDEDSRSSRRRKTAAAPIETKPLPEPDSPGEALDRITIPADAMARITEALSTGASIVVSDQGINQGETGEGTDFIVSLR